MKPKYPVYIISKGRHDCCFTADFFIQDGIDFYLVIEPQEEELYSEKYKKYLKILPFSNLGQGGTPARNFCWEDSKANGFERHWIFDDNIKGVVRLHKGKRIRCNSKIGINAIEEFTNRYENIALSGFNYTWFVMNHQPRPFFYNTHLYSALLIDNHIPYRWRLKYNEDVDLCLQVLDNGLCTVVFNAFSIQKISTTAKMRGGNQDELYLGNDVKKKVLKSKSLEEVWPQYVDTKIRYNRPHHFVNWKQHFKHPIIRRKDLNWEDLKNKKWDIKINAVSKIKSNQLKKFYKENK